MHRTHRIDGSLHRGEGWPRRPWYAVMRGRGASAALVLALWQGCSLVFLLTPGGPPPVHADEGQVYTYQDGDRTVRVVLQSDLEVGEDGTRSSGEHIVTKDSAATRGDESSGQPVFRSESSGILMTLPGGVLLVLDAEWSTAETSAFFARNRITLNRVSATETAANSFFVETDPGFPSLELANALAAQDGVRIASPNWWREHTRRSVGSSYFPLEF